jgi:DNA-binding CsgD family transcriptional regulator
VAGGLLVITPKTAGSHIEHIYRKIDAANRAQARQEFRANAR